MDNISSGEQEIKFDQYAEELLEKIKKENIPIHPTLWELLNHVLGNRIYALELTIGDFLSNPKWLFKATSFVMAFLYKVSGGRGKIFPMLYYLQKIQNNVRQMEHFIKRLRETTKGKPGF